MALKESERKGGLKGAQSRVISMMIAIKW